jgi:hypothetical protein
MTTIGTKSTGYLPNFGDMAVEIEMAISKGSPGSHEHDRGWFLQRRKP